MKVQKFSLYWILPLSYFQEVLQVVWKLRPMCMVHSNLHWRPILLVRLQHNEFIKIVGFDVFDGPITPWYSWHGLDGIDGLYYLWISNPGIIVRQVFEPNHGVFMRQHY